MCHGNEEWYKNWRGTDLSFWNWHEELHKFWPEHSKVQKVCFNWLLVTKVYIAWATKVQRSHLSKHWRVMQILKKSWSVFEKRLEIFVNFSPEHLKVSKLGLWWDPCVQSRKGMTLKFAKELCVMTMKNNAKFEEELTCHFKTDMRNLTNFHSSTRKSKKIAL